MQDKIWNTMKKNEQKNKNYCYSFNVHDWNIDREIKKKNVLKKILRYQSKFRNKKKFKLKQVVKFFTSLYFFLFKKIRKLNKT